MALVPQSLAPAALPAPRPSACPAPFQAAPPCGRLPASGPAACSAVKTEGNASSSTHVDRRTAIILTSSLVTSYFQLQRSPAAQAQEEVSASTSSQRGLARYIRKRKLDPLDTYVPMVLTAQQQLLSAGEVMASDAGAARSLLRQGAFSGVRDNIRAVGEYAVQNNQSASSGSSAALVPGFFAALNEFDQLLLAASKPDAKLDLEEAKTKHSATVKALDDLLATVPAEVMAKAQTVLAQTSRAAASAGASAAAGADTEEERLLRSLLAQ